MLQAALVIVRFYQELADLECVMYDRLEKLCNARLS